VLPFMVKKWPNPPANQAPAATPEGGPPGPGKPVPAGAAQA
jgi:hypothetical protein